MAFTVQGNPPKHEPIAYVCAASEMLSPQQAAILVIHETLHIAGQMEDGTTVFGPGNPPDSTGITYTIEDACGLSWY